MRFKKNNTIASVNAQMQGMLYNVAAKLYLENKREKLKRFKKKVDGMRLERLVRLRVRESASLTREEKAYVNKKIDRLQRFY